jgi:hypothetical protein
MIDALALDKVFALGINRFSHCLDLKTFQKIFGCWGGLYAAAMWPLEKPTRKP